MAIGCALVYRFAGLAAFQPRWAGALLIFGAGTAAGIGLTACVFFACRLAVPRMPKLSLMVETALLAWLGYEIWRKRVAQPAAAISTRAPFTAPLIAALLVAFAIATGAMAEAWVLNPDGSWDAWSIWNLRARFLAAPGALTQRAWSPALASWSHPEYPLLLSSFVARCWVYSGSMADAAPIAVSYFFFLALLAMLIGGFAVWRSRALGLLAGLILLGSPSLLREVTSQYADIPLACYFAAATIFALLDRPLLAGLFAGLAAWTKDEGLLFLLVFLVSLALFRRGQIVRVCLGAVPGTLLVLIFKSVLAHRSSTYFGQSLRVLAGRIFDPTRLGLTSGAFLHDFFAMGVSWYHPVLPALALMIGLRFDRSRDSDLRFAAAIPAAMLAGYFAIFLITPYDLNWQLDTSLYRLLAQLWPCFLIAALTALRAPESLAVEIPEAPAKARKRAKARHA